ncbi:MAG TPA: hypothetical protein PKO06_19800, partial [Candidatus Ozemobacteraceae bacterium]|nr:hypothetical protein [Candidatus Ozemobacteraceae bacterium]
MMLDSLIAENPVRFLSLFLMGFGLWLFGLLLRTIPVTGKQHHAWHFTAWGCLSLSGAYFFELLRHPNLDVSRFLIPLFELLSQALFLEAGRLALHQRDEDDAPASLTLTPILWWFFLLLIPGV